MFSAAIDGWRAQRDRSGRPLARAADQALFAGASIAVFANVWVFFAAYGASGSSTVWSVSPDSLLAPPIAIIVVRDFIVAGMRERRATRDGAAPAIRGDGWATASQITALAALFLAPALLSLERGPAAADFAASLASPWTQAGQTAWTVGLILMWLAALSSIATAVQYARETVDAARTRS